MFIIIYSKMKLLWGGLRDAVTYGYSHKSSGVGLLLCLFSSEAYDLIYPQFFFFDKVLGMGFILWTMPWIHDFHAIIAPVSMPCQDSHCHSFHNSQLGKTENFWPPLACKTPSSTIKASQCRRSFEVRISLFSLYSMTQVPGVFNNMALPSCSVR